MNEKGDYKNINQQLSLHLKFTNVICILLSEEVCHDANSTIWT